MDKPGSSAKSQLLFVRSWFELTVSERWIIAVVLALALLGLTARYYHMKKVESEPYTPPVPAANVKQ